MEIIKTLLYINSQEDVSDLRLFVFMNEYVVVYYKLDEPVDVNRLTRTFEMLVHFHIITGYTYFHFVDLIKLLNTFALTMISLWLNVYRTCFDSNLNLK